MSSADFPFPLQGPLCASACPDAAGHLRTVGVNEPLGNGRHDEWAAGCARLHKAGDRTGLVGEPLEGRRQAGRVDRACARTGHDAGTRDLQEMGRGGGLVLLGGIRKLAAQTVPDLMQKFLATSGNEHTRFELHTESSFTADLLQAVAEERLDMAFVSHPGDDTVFENVAFARLPFVVVAPPNHPLAQKSSVTLRETLPYPFMYFSKRGALQPTAAQRFFAFCQAQLSQGAAL